jgi:hypothetical protein
LEDCCEQRLCFFDPILLESQAAGPELGLSLDASKGSGRAAESEGPVEVVLGYGEVSCWQVDLADATQYEGLASDVVCFRQPVECCRVGGKCLVAAAEEPVSHRDVRRRHTGTMAVVEGLEQVKRALEMVECLGRHLPIGIEFAELVQERCLPEDVAGAVGGGHADVEDLLPLVECSLKFEQAGRGDRGVPAGVDVAVVGGLSQHRHDAGPDGVEPDHRLGTDQVVETVRRGGPRTAEDDQMVPVVCRTVRGAQHTIRELLNGTRLAPAGAGCLSLAWQHRRAILN